MIVTCAGQPLEHLLRDHLIRYIRHRQYACEAWELLTEYTETPALRRHAMTVEAVMRHFAALNGEVPEIWGAVGLLHDLDYEKYPEEHCTKAAKIPQP